MADPNNSNDPKPVQDLSPRVVELARAIDRLTPGTYMVRIEKPDVRAVDWQVDITRQEKIASMRLPKHRSNYDVPPE